jgi:deoxycytidylate deaminase
MATRLNIEQARLQAEKSYIDMATQYGCILIHNGKIVSRGNNKRKGVRTTKIKQCPLRG